MSRAWALVLALVTVALGAQPAQAATVKPASCRERIAVSCAWVTVPLDRSGRVTGSVRLYVERLGEDRPKPRALLFLAGGPGQAATPIGPDVAPALANVLDDRDVLILDQRGTGRSGALRCTARRTASVAAQLAACAKQLGAARDHYATADSVADIDEVRTALGIDALTLYGTSYGTKVALDYAAAHAGNVESLVLDSVVPAGPVEPLGRSSWTAIARVLRTLCAAGRCRGITEDPVADLAAVEDRAARGATLRRITGRGRPLRVRLQPGLASGLVYDGDFAPALRTQLPAALHAAAHGDAAALGRLLARTGELARPQPVADPLFVATTCADGAFPWPVKAGSAARHTAARGALERLRRSLPFRMPLAALSYTSAFEPCADWPAPAPPAPVGPIPDVPALVVSGTADVRTPTEDARAVARLLPRSQLLVVRGAGHSVIGNTVKDCPGRALLAFLRGRTVRQCAERTVPAPRPLAPRTLAGEQPWGGLPPRAGRIVRAVRATVADVQADLLQLNDWPAGGLRGGWYRPVFDDATLELHGVEVVGGVRVSGTVPLLARLRTAARLRVRAGHSQGTLRLRAGGRIEGTIDGVRVRAVVRPPRATSR